MDEKEIRYKFNQYISNNYQLQKFFDDLNVEDGIMLQCFFEGFAKTMFDRKKGSE